MKSYALKETALKKSLLPIDKLAIAFSGGVDSTLLAAVAAKTLGRDNVILITAATRFVPHWELDEARELADQIGVKHTVVTVGVDNVNELTHNPPDRCYFCKRAVLRAISAQAKLQGFDLIADGSNADDKAGSRPGLKALKEFSVISPLADAGFTKKEVRELSRKMRLPTADKPAYACLATRVPYNERLKPERLKRIEKAEALLLPMFTHGVRVRDYLVSGKKVSLALARVEVPEPDMKRALSPEIRKQIIEKLHKAGYTYVTVDLEALRSGSMDI
jgi:uncharacterized protein